jgi:hypothetical protein
MSRETGRKYLIEVCSRKATLPVERRFAAAIALMGAGEQYGIETLVDIVKDQNVPDEIRIAAATYLLSAPEPNEAEQAKLYGGTA